MRYTYEDNLLLINGIHIEFQHHIATIVELTDILVILFDNPNSGRTKDQPINNVCAINFVGDRLWNIKDIIPEDNLYTMIRKDGNNIVVVDFNCVNYTIDVNKLEVIDNKWIK